MKNHLYFDNHTSLMKANSLTISSFYDKDYYLFYEPFPYIRRKIFISMLSKSLNPYVNMTSTVTRTGTGTGIQNYQNSTDKKINVLKAYFNKSVDNTISSRSTVDTFIGPKSETNLTISFNKLFFRYASYLTTKKIYNVPKSYFFLFYKNYFKEILSLDDSQYGLGPDKNLDKNWNYYEKTRMSRLINLNGTHTNTNTINDLIDFNKKLTKKMPVPKSEKIQTVNELLTSINFTVPNKMEQKHDKAYWIKINQILNNQSSVQNQDIISCTKQILLLLFKFQIFDKNKVTKNTALTPIYLKNEPLFIKELNLLNKMLLNKSSGTNNLFCFNNSEIILKLPKEFIVLLWPYISNKIYSQENESNWNPIKNISSSNFNIRVASFENFQKFGISGGHDKKRKKKDLITNRMDEKNTIGYLSINMFLSNINRLLDSGSLNYYIEKKNKHASLLYLNTYWKFLYKSFMFYSIWNTMKPMNMQQKTSRNKNEMIQKQDLILLNEDERVKNLIKHYFTICKFKLPKNLENKDHPLQSINLKAKSAKLVTYLMEKDEPLFFYFNKSLSNGGSNMTSLSNVSQLVPIINKKLNQNDTWFNMRQNTLNWLTYNMNHKK